MAPRIKQLEVVWEQRQRVEREKQRAVAELQSHANWIEERIHGSHDTLTAIRDELRDTLTPQGRAGGGVRFSDVRLQAGATLHAQLRLQTLAIELAGVRNRLHQAREELKAAASQRKAVELLLDRRREELRRATERRESAELDEISISRRKHADHDRMEIAS